MIPEGDGLRPAGAGLVLGLAAGEAATRMIRDLLYDVRPRDASALAGVAIVPLLAAGIACVLRHIWTRCRHRETNRNLASWIAGHHSPAATRVPVRQGPTVRYPKTSVIFGSTGSVRVATIAEDLGKEAALRAALQGSSGR